MPTVRGPIRARDLRANIAEYGFENGVVYTLEALLDEYAQTRQHLRDMTSLLDQCIDQVSKMVSVGTTTTQQLEQLKRDREAGDAIDHGNPRN